MKRSKESNNEGNNNKFASIANNVTETNKPRATVPPNSDAINMNQRTEQLKYKTYLHLFLLMLLLQIF